MPDLHAWISQKIGAVEETARQASAWGATWYHDDFVNEIRDDNGGTIAIVYRAEYANHIVSQDPAAALRRCAADRKILARHNIDPDRAKWSRSEATACKGCGTYGDCDWSVTDNLNDCPELLDLAEGYGLTEDERGQLDRPQPPPRQATNSRPEWDAWPMGVLQRTPTPTADVPAALRGPDWKPQG